MKIIIDIGHPAHVHLFKNFAWKMQEKGHQVYFTAREKEHEVYLLQTYHFHYKSFGPHYSTKTMKIFGLFKFDLLMFFYALRLKPDLFISHGSIYASHASWLLRKPHVSLEDTGNLEQIRLYKPFTDVIITPENLDIDLGIKQVRYNSYHEMAYLHSKYFKPSPDVYQLLNLPVGEPYGILRFVSWNATHDTGQKGLSIKQKRIIYEYLSENFPVFISSESNLPEEFEKHRLNIPPDKIHDAIYYASVYIGEGATMACESGLMGTPAIYVNSQRATNCEDLSNYDLVFSLTSTEKILERTSKIITRNFKNKCRKNRERLLDEKIDLTAFLISIVEEKYLHS